MSEKTDSNVDHPKHYNAHPSGVECIDVIEYMGLNLGNAVKYLWRAGLKGSRAEDLRKARWYVMREIAKRTRTAARFSGAFRALMRWSDGIDVPAHVGGLVAQFIEAEPNKRIAEAVSIMFAIEEGRDHYKALIRVVTFIDFEIEAECQVETPIKLTKDEEILRVAKAMTASDLRAAAERITEVSDEDVVDELYELAHGLAHALELP